MPRRIVDYAQDFELLCLIYDISHMAHLDQRAIFCSPGDSQPPCGRQSCASLNREHRLTEELETSQRRLEELRQAEKSNLRAQIYAAGAAAALRSIEYQRHGDCRFAQNP